MTEDQVFWVGQKAFIVRDDGAVLVLRDPAEGLDFPGGKIQRGEEDLARSLQREVHEETGIEIDIGEPFVTWWNEFPARHKYAGKKVFLVGYRCRLLSGEVRLSSEHDQFRWVTRDNYREVFENSAYFRALEKYFENR